MEIAPDGVERPTLMDTLKSKNQMLKMNDMSMLMLVAKFYMLLASGHNVSR